MIATITLQSHRMTQSQDHRFSLNSNTAGSPLPLIPRRSSSTRPSLTSSPSCPFPTRSSQSVSPSGSGALSAPATITPATLQKDDSDSSSTSSGSESSRPTIRARRLRGVRNASLCPPELSTPIPTIRASSSSQTLTSPLSTKDTNASDSTPRGAASRPLLYSPGMSLRLSIDSLKRSVSESHVSPSASVSPVSGSQSASALFDSSNEAKLIRKKSGQVVRSSLKSSRSASRTSLSVLTFTPSSSKSEPTTPSKAVHFDTKEHVKLFLAEQKPLAVSRDGSPTDDTSGTDSDFPRFIYGDGAAGADGQPISRKTRLVMQVANMPVRINSTPDSDVLLEELCLSNDGQSIQGKVRVKNLAFSKAVAIRFTFDQWQTTSEVTGRWMESLGGAEWDRFGFTIRLNDLLARIEGKTLVLAVRYTVAGKEIWDNNGGRNYVATFTRTKIPAEERRDSHTLSDDEASTEELRSKLEKVAGSKDRSGPAFVASKKPADTTPDFKSSASLAARYDFANSLKSPWKPSKAAVSAPGLHSRTQSFPLASKPNSSIPWPSQPPMAPKRVTLGSPRDLSDDTFVERAQEQVDIQQPQARATRNHQRGYFDIAVAPASMRRTPPGTPRSPLEFPVPRSASLSPPPSRYNSFPPMIGAAPAVAVAQGVQADSGDSDLSTPSMVTPSSSRESTPSPTEPHMNVNPTATATGEVGDETLSPETHYRQFLSKFCFFTGPDSTAAAADVIPRTHSASSIEEFLLSGSSPDASLQSLAHILTSPTRSSSLDDLPSSRSGSVTPTPSSVAISRISLVDPEPVLT